MFGSNKNIEPAPPPPTPSSSPPAPARFERPVDNGSSRAKEGGVLSSDVSIKGNVTFRGELVIDGEVEGKISSTGTLTVGEHARIRGEIRARSVVVRGNIEGNIVASERCALEAGAMLRGDIEAPRFALDENASFLGSARIATKKTQ